jgi:hypothetical protein
MLYFFHSVGKKVDMLVLIISISTHLFIHLTTQKKKNRNYAKYL